jgi:AAA15 family ATPase/GTPase
LESIFALKAVSTNERQERLPRILRSQFRQQHGIELWHNRQPTNNPVIKLKIDQIDFTLTFTSNATFSNYTIRLWGDSKGEISFNTDSFLRQISNLSNPNFIHTLEESLAKVISNMELVDDFLIRMPHLWEPSVDTSATDDYEKIPQTLKLADYIQNEKRLTIRKNGRDYFIDTVGDGNRTGLALLGILKKLKNTVILVEEIENHHHASSLLELIPKFVSVCQTNNIQAFITTHSPQILQMFSNVKESKFYHLKKSDEEILVDQIQFNDAAMLMDIGWDVARFLQYEKNVLVEGPIDEAIFRNTFFRIKGDWPYRAGILIQSVGGISKQKEILKILAQGDRTIFAETDKDNRTVEEIQNSLFDPFKHDLLRDGYILEQDNEIIQLKKDESIRKFPRKNLIITGLPDKFPDLKKHTTDDYLLEILRQEPELFENMPDRIPDSTLSFKGENSKERLQQVFVEYGPLKASQIIQKCKIKSIPQELKDIIERIS